VRNVDFSCLFFFLKKKKGGDSVLALLPTGGGKSLCYVLPTLAFPNTLTLVVSPLLALMRDQMAALPPSLPGALLASDQTAAETAKQLARVARGEARVLFVAPERAVLPAFRAALARLPPVRLVCVDEAHCLSMWSHCFRTSYLLLRELLLESVRPRCVLALTATAVPKTCEQVCESLNLQHVVRASLLRPNLELQAVLDPPDAHASLKKLLSSSPIVDMWRSGSGRVIVYVSTQRETEQIAQLLTMEGVPASSYHAGQDPKLRRTTEDQFRSGKVQIVVATVAFGMGIDVSCVRCIVHFDLPKSVENYVQEVGRAGRDGAPASCVCFVSSVQLLRLTSLSYSHSVDARKLRDMLVAVRARGEGVGCIPTDSFVPRDVAATMLAWMHEEGLLRMLPEGYGSFQIRFFASGDQGSAVLAWALSLGTKKKKDAEWTVVDACKCAKDIGKTVAEVHEELEGFSKSKRIGYKLTDRSFFFELGERFSERKKKKNR
jgi:ATP-dependent DNA helicase Q4